MPMGKVIRKFSSFEEVRVAHFRGWQESGIEVINEPAWQLVIDYRKRHDIQPYEPVMERRVRFVRRAWKEEQTS
jgi:hypothetical protein